MKQRRRITRLAKPKRFLDSTRRRIGRKRALNQIVQRRIKQINMTFELEHQADND
jgi:hypothetical protein